MIHQRPVLAVARERPNATQRFLGNSTENRIFQQLPQPFHHISPYDAVEPPHMPQAGHRQRPNLLVLRTRDADQKVVLKPLPIIRGVGQIQEHLRCAMTVPRLVHRAKLR
jgi:hypothetical protein